MTDPIKLPATTCVNLYSSYRPHPFLRGVSIPIPSNFTPADNPTTFNQAAIKNTAQVDFSSTPYKPKPAATPRARKTSAQANAAPTPQVKKGRPAVAQESKRDFPPASKSTRFKKK